MADTSRDEQNAIPSQAILIRSSECRGFLKLPPELRNKIYNLCIERELQHLSPHLHRGDRFYRGLGGTCAQIRTEFRSLYVPQAPHHLLTNEVVRYIKANHTLLDVMDHFIFSAAFFVEWQSKSGKSGNCLPLFLHLSQHPNVTWELRGWRCSPDDEHPLDHLLPIILQCMQRLHEDSWKEAAAKLRSIYTRWKSKTILGTVKQDYSPRGRVPMYKVTEAEMLEKLGLQSGKTWVVVMRYR